MKARCAMMVEAMAPCDALAGVRFRCESGAVRCGAVRCRVVRWDGNGTGCVISSKRQVGNKVGR